MCGICGVLSSENKPKEILRRGIDRMNQLQSCRGPDDEGIYIDSKESLILGHRRLSIIDLSASGKEPFSYDEGNLQITFNGEIYNYLELKKELLVKGYEFRTETDTEVILALYKEIGVKAFEKLRGMFSFGLWDNGKKKLFLVKDRYGIKPLYYYSDDKNLIFASTVKAIEKSGLIFPENSSAALIGFLVFGSVPLPATTLKNVFALPPGHYLEKTINSEARIIKYYDSLSFFENKNEIDFHSAISGVRSRLEEAVRLHLISDAPLGVFLSGGIDSSVIAALASINRKVPVHTLSVVFDEAEFSEKPYQDLVVRKIESEHREIKITKNDFFNNYDSVFEAMDQPTIDGVNTFFISKAAKDAGLKVVLSGLGADEIFCGYPSFKKAGFLRSIQKLPKILKTPLKAAQLLGNRYAKVNYFLSDDILKFYLGIRGLFSPEETAKILDIDYNEVSGFLNNYTANLFNKDTLKKIGALHPVNLLSYLELQFYLQNQLLKDTDFMSMFHSIEVRVPFLDHKVVEYVSGLPPEIKIDNRTNKPLLTAGLSDLVPHEIFERRKMGFTLPFQKWLNSKDVHWSRFWAREVLKKWQ